ncbi:MAG: alpha/beta hydrolase [Actinomycetota bacterium]
METFAAAQSAVLDRYDVDADSHFVEIPAIGGRAHILTVGSGPSVVMVNGIGTPGAMWAPLMSQLDGFTLHAVDLPGYGLTDSTPRLADHYKATAISFLEQVVIGLGLDSAMFMSNSLGSLWATWLAIDRPDRVTAITHVGCPALVLGTSAPAPMRLMSVRPLAELMMKIEPPSPKQIERLSKMVHEYPLAPEIAELLLETERLPGFQPTFLSTLHTLVRLRGAHPDMAVAAEDLARVTQPVQLIWGRDDPFGSPSVGERVAGAIPDAELHVVDGGHTPWLTEASSIGSLAESFLMSHSYRGS